MITILHLSDLHWDKSDSNNLHIIHTALKQDLVHLRETENLSLDFVIFSGDLVKKGENKEDFSNAWENFLTPILTTLNLTKDHIFIAPGNHDMSRAIARDDGFINAGLQSILTNVDSLNKFIAETLEGKESNLIALNRMNNFFQFIEKINNENTFLSNKFFSLSKIECNNLKIGIACFNTAWRASGESDNIDRSKLLIGEKSIDIAVEKLSECDLKIAVFHHPLDWLAEFDQVSVEARINSQFDILFCGHTHRQNPQARTTSVGSSVISQTGSLYQNRDYYNGYQIVRIDPTIGEAEFFIRVYQDIPRRSFDKGVNIAPDGKVSVTFKNRSTTPSTQRVEAVLRDARTIIRQMAADQINIGEGGSDFKFDAKDAFVCPPLSAQRSREIEEEEQTRSSDVSLETLLGEDGNWLLVGIREAGKSSLAHYIAVCCAEGLIDRPRIPIIVDYRQFKKNTYGLKKSIASYLGNTPKMPSIDSALTEGDFIFIIDNFSASRENDKEFETLCNEFCKNRWLCFVDARVDVVGALPDVTKIAGFKSAHIQPLPRKSIRELTKRWSNVVGNDSEKTFETVMGLLQRDNLPRTGYIVTLLLWAVYKEKKFEKINESLLLTHMIDFLLGKADFEQVMRREFDPRSKEITLQSLAEFLHRNDGVASINDSNVFLIEFFKRKGLTYSAPDILNKLIECGILSRSGDFIKFKYRCFQDYFMACLFKDDQASLEKVMSEYDYINYSRELDLLSGLRRRNTEIINMLSERITNSSPLDIKSQDLNTFDNLAIGSATGPTEKRLSEIRKKKLTAEQIDDLMDIADRKMSQHRQARKEENLKSSIEPDEIVTICEKDGELPRANMDLRKFILTMDLLGRVIRNSEFNDASEKIIATKLYFQHMGKCFLLMSEVIKQTIEEFKSMTNQDLKHNERIIRVRDYIQKNGSDTIQILVNKFMLLSFQDDIKNQISTEKIISICEEIFANEDTTTIEKVLLSMLFLDMPHPRWDKYFNSIINESHKKKFILDVLTDKIWKLIHTRVVSDELRDKIGVVAANIQLAQGTPKRAKGSIMEDVRKTAAKTAMREAATDTGD